MNITYNEKENSIDINDGLKNHYLLIKALLIITLINAILNLYDISKATIGFMEIIWILLGAVSIKMLYSLFVKESSADKIEVAKIQRFEEKTKFGKKQYFFELINGKKRFLKSIKTEQDLKNFRTVLKKAAISS
ncbi:hypothetical protein [Flavobacterium sp.]